MKADYIVKNASVFTSDSKNPSAKAFAVKDGKFVYVGDEAGLSGFEGEVKEMAKMVDNLKPYSLILLNETFQTTSYDEGAVGIYNIISVFGRFNVKFIFVTHLLKLFDMCDNDRILLMETKLNTDDNKSPYIITPIEKR